MGTTTFLNYEEASEVDFGSKRASRKDLMGNPHIIDSGLRAVQFRDADMWYWDKVKQVFRKVKSHQQSLYIEMRFEEDPESFEKLYEYRPAIGKWMKGTCKQCESPTFRSKGGQIICRICDEKKQIPYYHLAIF